MMAGTAAQLELHCLAFIHNRRLIYCSCLAALSLAGQFRQASAHSVSIVAAGCLCSCHDELCCPACFTQLQPPISCPVSMSPMGLVNFLPPTQAKSVAALNWLFCGSLSFSFLGQLKFSRCVCGMFLPFTLCCLLAIVSVAAAAAAAAVPLSLWATQTLSLSPLFGVCLFALFSPCAFVYFRLLVTLGSRSVVCLCVCVCGSAFAGRMYTAVTAGPLMSTAAATAITAIVVIIVVVVHLIARKKLSVAAIKSGACQNRLPPLLPLLTAEQVHLLLLMAMIEGEEKLFIWCSFSSEHGLQSLNCQIV